MPHYRRCLEQASFESHNSLVDRVGFKRRAKSASWAGSLPWSARIQPGRRQPPHGCQPFASRTRQPASGRNRAGVALRFNRTGSNKDEKCEPRPFGPLLLWNLALAPATLTSTAILTATATSTATATATPTPTPTKRRVIWPAALVALVAVADRPAVTYRYPSTGSSAARPSRRR
jgi:hypothetical protein